MDPNAVVLDISSDEETGVDYEPEIEDYDWISELLNEDVKEKDDSDDVVVVGEVIHKLNLKSSTVEDDDDCMILDDDPDKPVSVVDDAANCSDELLVVGEKGQIACRDYPHPRHLCAKFPFGTTSHETHCDQCHCYVCDTLAPCVYWGAGSSIIDHCHATDKDETWKAERKNVKLEKSGAPPVPRFPHTSLSKNQVPLPTHSLPRNPVSRPNVIRPCSSSTNFGVPNIISQNRSQRAGLGFPKNRLPSRMVSPNLLGVRNNIIRRDRFQNVGNIGHKFVSSPSVFKRAGTIGGSFSVNQPYNPLYDVNLDYAPQYSRNFTPAAIPMDKNLSRWQDSLSSMDLHPDLSAIFENSLPSQPAVYSQPASQPKDSQNIYQHGNQTPYPTDSSFSDIGISLVDNTSKSNQPSQDENPQLQSAPTKDPSLVPDFNAQLPGSEANPNSLYFEFEDWLMENQSFPGVSQAAAPSDPNILSPESAHIDAGLLYFDFETSMNGLTRA